MDLGNTLYFPVTWASNICAGIAGEQLFVTGKLPMIESEVEPRRDAQLQYLLSVNVDFGKKYTGGKSPHIRFANADSDEKLIEFVREFGPVVAAYVKVIEPDFNQGTLPEDESAADMRLTIAAFQDLATLRRERLIYAGALRLLAELGRGRDQACIANIRQDVADIVQGVLHWPDQWEKERQWRTAQVADQQVWHFDSSCLDDFLWWQGAVNAEGTSPIGFPGPYDSAFWVLCGLINAFRTRVDHVANRRVETLPRDSLRCGMRPALYLILRSEYLSRGATAVCGNDRCGKFFVRGRAGAIYCSPECSLKHRQRKYWKKTGAKKRKTRRAKQKARKKKSAKR